MSTKTSSLEQALREFTEAVVNADDGLDVWHSSAFDLEFLSDAVNDALYGADYLGGLEALELIDKFVDHVRTALVIACRSTGDAWDDIGEAMGRDRQWAWRTYHQRADYDDTLSEKAVTEFEAAIPNFQAWGFDTESMEPEMRKAISLLEQQAKRTYERVQRAVRLTVDARRRALIEAEKDAERAKKPGRRPGPQPKDSHRAGSAS